MLRRSIHSVAKNTLPAFRSTVKREFSNHAPQQELAGVGNLAMTFFGAVCGTAMSLPIAQFNAQVMATYFTQQLYSKVVGAYTTPDSSETVSLIHDPKSNKLYLKCSCHGEPQELIPSSLYEYHTIDKSAKLYFPSDAIHADYNSRSLEVGINLEFSLVRESDNLLRFIKKDSSKLRHSHS